MAPCGSVALTSVPSPAHAVLRPQGDLGSWADAGEEPEMEGWGLNVWGGA